MYRFNFRNLNSLNADSTEDIQPDQALGFGWILLVLAHVPLAYLMQLFPVVSTAHALLVVGIGVLIALSSRNSERVVYVILYIAGAETLWRMTGASVFWEYGKYATVLITGLAILLQGSSLRPGPMLGFLILLLPSTAITLTSLSLSEARDQISFYLSGALALAFCAWYFNGRQITMSQVKRLIFFFIAPLYGILTLAMTGALNAPLESYLAGESSLLSSGGYGPNQVSSILGLGALFALIYLFIFRSGTMVRVFLTITMLVFLVQAALTLSRGGIYLFGLGALAALFYVIREPRLRLTIIFVILLFFVAFYYLTPMLDQFTGGGLTARFADTSTTGRIELMQEELQTWYSNVVFGVGPGMTTRERMLRGMQVNVASHNEFTRMLAEHGLFGLAAILLLIFMAARNLQRATSPVRQGIAAALIVWSFAIMVYTSFRVVAPAVMLGLSGAILLVDQEEAKTVAEKEEVAEGTMLNLPKPSFPRRLG